MSDDLRARLADALANTPAAFMPADLPSPFGGHSLGEGQAGHDYHGGCALCRGEINTLVEAVMTALAPEPETEADLGEQMRHRELGVYRLFWHSGGCSVAAVGMLHDGSRWYAPANWTPDDLGGVVSTDWSRVKSAELVESYQASRRKRPRKDAA
jgi:hypothetical protein